MSPKFSITFFKKILLFLILFKVDGVPIWSININLLNIFYGHTTLNQVQNIITLDIYLYLPLIFSVSCF